MPPTTRASPEIPTSLIFRLFDSENPYLSVSIAFANQSHFAPVFKSPLFRIKPSAWLFRNRQTSFIMLHSWIDLHAIHQLTHNSPVLKRYGNVLSPFTPACFATGDEVVRYWLLKAYSHARHPYFSRERSLKGLLYSQSNLFYIGNIKTRPPKAPRISFS